MVHIQTLLVLPRRLEQLAGPANYGVQLFFVVSALTLFMSYEARSKADKRPIAAFFIRRFFRIAPLFWLAVPVYLLFLGTGPRESAPGGIHLGQILATLSFVHGWHPSAINSVVPGGWSIAVEMNFYLFLPLLFAVLKTLRRSVIACAAVLAASVVVSVATRRWLVTRFPDDLVRRFTYYWFPRQLAVFLLGIVLFFLIKRLRQPSTLGGARDQRLVRRLPEISIVLMLSMALVSDRLPVAYFWFSCGFVSLALGLALRPIGFLVNPMTRYIGKVSFSAYISHFIVIAILGKAILRGFGKVGGDLRQLAIFSVLYLVCGVGTILVSSLTYSLIEAPGQDLGRSLIKWLGYGRA